MMSVENLQKIDIPQDPKSEVKQEETLDNILQSKISDQNTLQKAKSIFEEVQKSFPEPINEHIKELDDFQMDYIVNVEENPVKYLIEYMDMATGGKTIDVTKNIIEKNTNIVEKNTNIVEKNTNIVEKNTNVVEV